MWIGTLSQYGVFISGFLCLLLATRETPPFFPPNLFLPSYWPVRSFTKPIRRHPGKDTFFSQGTEGLFQNRHVIISPQHLLPPPRSDRTSLGPGTWTKSRRMEKWQTHEHRKAGDLGSQMQKLQQPRSSTFLCVQEEAWSLRTAEPGGGVRWSRWEQSLQESSLQAVNMVCVAGNYGGHFLYMLSIYQYPHMDQGKASPPLFFCESKALGSLAWSCPCQPIHIHSHFYSFPIISCLQVHNSGLWSQFI